MRFRLIFLAFNLVATAAQAQQLTPQVQPGPAMAPPPAAPTQGNLQGAPAAASAPSAVTPGVVTLSDVARQSPADAPKPGPVQPAPVEVPAITAMEGNGKVVDAARVRMRGSEFQAGPSLSIVLSRISTVGDDTWAVLWVKGQNRKVLPGARVLQYTVGEIRDDGVCLYNAKSNGKVKDKCQELVTFLQGV